MSRARQTIAFRMVAEKLTNPLGELLGVIAEVKSMLVMGREIPLADVSPFGVLPKEAAASREASVEGRSATYIDLPERRASTRAERLRAESRIDSADTAYPVFSLRRSPVGFPKSMEAQTRRLPSRSPYGEEGPSRSTAGELGALAEPVAAEPGTMALPLVPRARESVVERFNPPVPQGEAARLWSGALPEPRPRETATPFEIIDVLASELLAPRPTPFATLGAAAGTSGQDVSATPTPQPSTDSQRSSIAPGVLSSGPEEREVQRLVEESEPEKSGPRDVASMESGTRPAIANFPEVAASSASSPRFHPDAETLASLVNEVLAEQARRHGVDLS